MSTSAYLDGAKFADMIKAGAANLRIHAEAINDLNVFPIPDGDTGDNMLLTMLGGSDAANTSINDLSKASRAIADGMLLGARGNSGVILSQFFDGIADGFKGVCEADADKMGSALLEGVKRAYGAVMSPAEGTILTVARCAAEYASNTKSESPDGVLKDFIDEAKRTLEKTPDMLPVLKKAGVVDSGGAGLIYIAEGMLKGYNGEISEYSFKEDAFDTKQDSVDIEAFTEESILEFGYCTEVLLRLQTAKTDVDAFDVKVIKEYLATIGDSIVAFKTGSAVKIHVHTMTPDKVLSFCQKYGEFLKVKIENMSLQHNNLLEDVPAATVVETSERKQYGVVAVASGDGIKELFSELGADIIVDGGQSMNPSAEAFIEAYRAVNAETVFVLPNNSNIVLAAKQAANMYTDSDIRVIETKSVGDGYAVLAMLSFDSDDADEIENSMIESIEGVVTAEISKSVRDACDVKAGEYIGFVGKDILTSNDTRLDAACSTSDKLNASDYEVCMIIRGEGVPEDEAEKFGAYITQNSPMTEIYHIDGKQGIYDYIIVLQ